MSSARNLNVRAGVLSVLILLVLLGIWYAATASSGPANSLAGMTAEQIEYAKMMGKDPGTTKSDGFPTLADMGTTAWGHLSNPFYDNGPNDKGVALQLGYSLARVALGFGLACLVAIAHQALPPTINLDDPDPECDLLHVPHHARPAPVRVVASNSLGFGGSKLGRLSAA